MKTSAGVPERLSCSQMEAEIALHAGGDLNDGVRQALLESHLAGCSTCREYQRRMVACLDVLQTCAAESAPLGRAAGVWPRVATALRAYDAQPVLARFNAWVPTTAIAAACAAMIFVTVIQVERGLPVAPSQNYFTDPEFAKTGLGTRSVVAPHLNGQDLQTTPVGLDAKLPRVNQRQPRGDF